MLVTMLDSIEVEVVEASARLPLWLIGVGVLVTASFLGVGKVASVRRKMLSLERAAHTDHLTGLLNRRASENRLQEDLVRARREADRTRERGPRSHSLVLVTANLDGLKQVNDRYGHEAGDWYLVSTRFCAGSQ